MLILIFMTDYVRSRSMAFNKLIHRPMCDVSHEFSWMAF